MKTESFYVKRHALEFYNIMEELGQKPRLFITIDVETYFILYIVEYEELDGI